MRGDPIAELIDTQLQSAWPEEDQIRFGSTGDGCTNRVEDEMIQALDSKYHSESSRMETIEELIKKDYTQEEIGYEIGISQPAVNKWVKKIKNKYEGRL